MSYSRREFGKLALAGLPAAALLGRSDSIFGAIGAQAKPNSLIDGVQIGTITYSYRSLSDQSAEATLKYIVDSGISAIELMGGPVESFAGIPSSGRGGRGEAPPIPEGAKMGSWNGKSCVIPEAPGARGGAGARGGPGGAPGGR